MTIRTSPVFVALNRTGVATARRLAATIAGAEVHGLMGRVPDTKTDATFTGVTEHLRALFRNGRPIVGLCASGVMIRALAPLLTDKRTEPPVLAVAADGSCVIPLLGGHRGANALAARLAAVLGTPANITTAGDVTGGVPLDEAPPGWRIDNPAAARVPMAALIDDQPVALLSDVDSTLVAWLTEATDGFVPVDTPPVPSDPAAGHPLVCVTDRTDHALSEAALVLRPPTLALGVGCVRGCPPDELLSLARLTLSEQHLSPDSVACVVSLDLKADEPAMHALGQALGVPVRFLDAAALEAETPRLATPSEVVYREVGCHGVAEGAALAAVGPGGTLVAPKRKSPRATCAVGRHAAGLVPERVGQAQGSLHIVGIGPGTPLWRTPEVTAAVAAATDLVGYHLYLDLLGEAQVGKARHVSDLGAETERARVALDLAARGRRVALVCSGDAGIYALATLIFELLEQEERPDWERVAVTVCPGVTAMQAAAARVGAPLGHDFCAISLSDLLTPRAVIERRVAAAAAADFVIAFYNPVSRRRRDALPQARETLLRHRPPETPVILARNLGRSGETITVTTLAALSVDDVDMLTLVLVGSSETRRAGRWVYTPRGYASKRETAS
ncbi:precorrin-3B C(17)-methyltransferase [Roseospira marina]|uniref:Precorrin-3B C(17)-methyltransferase n=1 Tax=Roseospira marina TaxID=140057 RepID=A0A5M6I8I0_9PROT|nr:precorrin-3B C(17)-methyltransferase [Roseospira marina]KAA5604115.1 precorrin-3B C(17)-methyltransferase [Roseospira marina]MBB4315782.1 cobalt-precorrin 5A hydrolase/precorrin-3B C17-methyltransferase [Roseospira marina]MBB5088979.1 cobalt-precorrin 5A hydrolase/precorrin-3B C17-methyltransferase [Roseospira marina]